MRSKKVAILSCAVVYISQSFSMEPERPFLSHDLSQKLFTAVEDYNNEAIKKIGIEHPALINLYGYHKGFGCEVTPLHVAVALNNISGVHTLLTLKADANAIIRHESGKTPLHLVRNELMVHSEPIARLLIQHGADVNSRDNHGNTPLFQLFYGFNANFDVAHYFLVNGADGDAQYKNGDTLLHRAVKGKRRYLIQLLLEHDVNLELRNKKRKTALDLALEAEEFSDDIKNEMTSLDYFKKADVLWYPATLADFQCPYRLLENNAFRFKKLMRLDSSSFQAENVLMNLFIALERGKDNKKWQAIVRNEKGYYFNRASFADLEKWVGKEAVDYVKSYFEEMCDNCLFECPAKNVYGFRYAPCPGVLEYHPHLFAGNNEAVFYALYHIMETDDGTDFEWLLSKYPCNLQGADKKGNTLLHGAMLHCRPKTVELLMKHGIDFTIQNKDGLMAHQVAEQKGLVGHKKVFIKALFGRLYSCGFYQNTASFNNIKKLLDSGFDVNTCHPETGASLLWQVMSGIGRESFEISSLLLQAGALVNAEAVNYRDKKVSPLWFAVDRWNNNLIVLLLEHGAVVTPKILEEAYRDHYYTHFSEGVRNLLQQSYDRRNVVIKK